MIEQYRARIREFFVRRLAYTISQHISCNAENRMREDWKVAESFISDPENFRTYVEPIVHLIGRDLPTQEMFDLHHGGDVDHAFATLVRDRGKWFSTNAYWAFMNEWRRNRYGGAPYCYLLRDIP